MLRKRKRGDVSEIRNIHIKQLIICKILAETGNLLRIWEKGSGMAKTENKNIFVTFSHNQDF